MFWKEFKDVDLSSLTCKGLPVVGLRVVDNFVVLSTSHVNEMKPIALHYFDDFVVVVSHFGASCVIKGLKGNSLILDDSELVLDFSNTKRLRSREAYLKCSVSMANTARKKASSVCETRLHRLEQLQRYEENYAPDFLPDLSLEEIQKEIKVLRPLFIRATKNMLNAEEFYRRMLYWENEEMIKLYENENFD